MADETNPNARPDAATAEELAKLTKAELVERVVGLTRRLDVADDLRRMERRRAAPEAAFAITALVALHREGLHDGAGDARYLKAARLLGDELVAGFVDEPEPRTEG